MPNFKVSYWETASKDGSHYSYSCHHCGKVNRYHKFPFCPYCGFKMAKNLEEYEEFIKRLYIEEQVRRKVG